MKKPAKKAKKKQKAKGGPKVQTGNGRIVPIGSRVLVKPFTKEELENKSNFGIILPDSDTKEKSEQGKVLAVGTGDLKDGKRVPPDVKVGDKVVFSKYGYDEFTIDGEDYYLIKEENILAVLK
jgi:chaperonin GroES